MEIALIIKVLKLRINLFNLFKDKKKYKILFQILVFRFLKEWNQVVISRNSYYKKAHYLFVEFVHQKFRHSYAYQQSK